MSDEDFDGDEGGSVYPISPVEGGNPEATRQVGRWLKQVENQTSIYELQISQEGADVDDKLNVIDGISDTKKSIVAKLDDELSDGDIDEAAHRKYLEKMDDAQEESEQTILNAHQRGPRRP